MISPATKSSPRSPQLEKARAQQWRPNAAKQTNKKSVGNPLNPSPASAAHDSAFSSPRSPLVQFPATSETELSFLTANNLKTIYEKPDGP